MRYDRLFTKLFCSPLLLEASIRAGFERVLLAFMNGQPADLPKAEDQPQFFGKKVEAARADKWADAVLEIDGSNASIHIDGAIDKNLSTWDRACFDACDLNDVDRALARVSSDKSIKNVLLCINSPGGSVNGVPETAARVAALAQQKNVFAYVDGMACSAAYWIAAAADQILATPSSMTGSIGVYLALLDQSRWLENEGLHVETIKSGTLKAAGASWKPLTDDERAHFQSMVDEIGVMFRGAVREKRPGIDDDTMQGQAFFGASGLQAKLVDAHVADRAAAFAQF
ncbi:MAG TPA: S49 family peptidase [Chthoniobacter sp.]|jgi:protease-4